MGGCSQKTYAIEPKPKKQGKALLTVKVGPDMFVSLKEGNLSQFYKIGEILGEGGFGCVRLATQKNAGIQRAIKQIRKDKILVEDEQQLFAEVDLLKQLDHPNIVKLYEMFQDSKNYYLITEYLEGGELFDRLKHQKTFSEKTTANYMKQFLSAVAYCHDRDIVHRDLKLENMMLDSKSADANLKLIDFGASVKSHPGEILRRKIGTPYYMAPEVLKQSYDKKCDVWSCGVILYILLCGYPPFNGDDNEIRSRILIGKFIFDPDEWSGISIEAKSFVTKLLTYDPKNRITINQALEDPWIVDRAPSTSINNNLLKNLTNFYATSKLEAAIQIFIVTQVQTSKEKDEILKQFKAFDKNNDGTLSKEEILNVYQQIYNDPIKSEKVCNEIFESADSDNSGQIDFTEFLVASQNIEKINNKQRLEKVFQMFDRDQNGQISKLELQQIMGGVLIDEQQWLNILEESDVNHDGEISLQEFIQLMQNYH